MLNQMSVSLASEDCLVPLPQSRSNASANVSSRTSIMSHACFRRLIGVTILVDVTTAVDQNVCVVLQRLKLVF